MIQKETDMHISVSFLKKYKIFQKISKNFKKPIDIFEDIVYNNIRRKGNDLSETNKCESGGTGRRARLRGVWLHRTGSSPVSRTTKTCENRSFLFIGLISSDIILKH